MASNPTTILGGSPAEALQALRRPFTVAAVKWKVQTGGDWGAICVGYIDARLVVDRLNAVVGGDWRDVYVPVPGGLECHLTVCGITRIDVGVASGDAAGGVKALYSDALKRAAVKFGIGVSIYTVPVLKLAPANLRVKNQKVVGIQPAGMAHLKDLYGQWLDRVGIEQFGEPLNHGDVDWGGAIAVGVSVEHDIDPYTGEIVASEPGPAPTGTARALTPRVSPRQRTAPSEGNPGSTGSDGVQDGRVETEHPIQAPVSPPIRLGPAAPAPEAAGGETDAGVAEGAPASAPAPEAPLANFATEAGAMAARWLKAGGKENVQVVLSLLAQVNIPPLEGRMSYRALGEHLILHVGPEAATEAGFEEAIDRGLKAMADAKQAARERHNADPANAEGAESFQNFLNGEGGKLL